MNACILKRRFSRDSETSIPGGFFGYFALCKQFEQEKTEIEELDTVSKNNLPIVSSITQKLTPQAAVMMHWSFLKY